jgi:hypothetical protein
LLSHPSTDRNSWCHVASWPKLKKIELVDFCQHPQNYVNAFQFFPDTVCELVLRKAQIYDLASLNRLPALRKLTLDGCWLCGLSSQVEESKTNMMTDATFWPRLEELSYRPGRGHPIHLPLCTGLRRLTLDAHNVSDGSPHNELFNVSQCKFLCALRLHYGSVLRPEALVQGLEECTELADLQLVGKRSRAIHWMYWTVGLLLHPRMKRVKNLEMTTPLPPVSLSLFCSTSLVSLILMSARVGEEITTEGTLQNLRVSCPKLELVVVNMLDPSSVVNKHVHHLKH